MQVSGEESGRNLSAYEESYDASSVSIAVSTWPSRTADWCSMPRNRTLGSR